MTAVASMPPVRRGTDPHFRRPGDVAALRELRRRGELDAAETFYPLHVRMCASCLLVQLPAYVSGEDIFSDYAYFSSYSDSWVAHAKRYAQAMIGRLGLTPDSLVTEVASNDGYLLQHFGPRASRCSGSSRPRTSPRRPGPAVSRPRSSSSAPETGREIASRYGRADLVAANNVFAHVPDIRGFAAGLRALVKDSGLVTLEFPHLLRLIERRQYDTIYHEHFSYLSLLTASRALAHGRAARGRRRRARHARRLAARVRPARGERRRADRAREGGARRGGGGRPAHPGRARRASRRRSLKIKRDLLGFLLDAARAGPVRWPATAPRAKATRCSTTAASGRTCSRTPSTAARTSRACSCPARTSRSTRRNARRDQARLRPRPALEPAGRDQPPARLRPVLGRPAGLPDPRARRVSEGSVRS